MKKVLILLLSGLVLTACQKSGSSGNEFVGKWKNSNVGTIEITPNNQSGFNVIDVTPGKYQGQPIDYCVGGAKLIDNSLVCGALGDFKMTIQDSKLVTNIGTFVKD